MRSEETRLCSGKPEYHVVSAFTHRGCGGNLAGIVFLNDLTDMTDSEMATLAARLGYSETAFVAEDRGFSSFQSASEAERSDCSDSSVQGCRLDPLECGKSESGKLECGKSECRKFGGCFAIRYFTPVEEVDFCGHATVAAYALMYRKGMIPAAEDGDPRRYLTRTASGEVEVRVRSEGSVFLRMNPPKILRMLTEAERLELVRILGFASEGDGSTGGHVRLAASAGSRKFMRSSRSSSDFPEDFLELRGGLVYAGLPDVLFPVESREVLNALSPDFEELARFSERIGAVGVHVFAPERRDEDGILLYARNFAPLYGIPEESATGTSNAGLTAYLHEFGVLACGMPLTVLQGERMGNLSEIRTRMFEDGSVEIGGDAAPLS